MTENTALTLERAARIEERGIVLDADRMLTAAGWTFAANDAEDAADCRLSGEDPAVTYVRHSDFDESQRIVRAGAESVLRTYGWQATGGWYLKSETYRGKFEMGLLVADVVWGRSDAVSTAIPPTGTAI